jgi:predicted phosphodiesterase
MTTLVIPDIHQRCDKVDQALQREQCDEVVFLGDWLDTREHESKVTQFYKTCLFLRYHMLLPCNERKYVFILGNHDLYYIYNNTEPYTHRVVKRPMYGISGPSKNKIKLFRKCFYSSGVKDTHFLKTFRVAYASNGFVFSHAGIVPEHIPYGKTTQEFIDVVCHEAWMNFRNPGHNYNWVLSQVGKARFGDYHVGGPIWLDGNSEFYAHESIGPQVFGHTVQHEPKSYADINGALSWNIDTGEHYAIIKNGLLTTKTYAQNACI